MPLAASLIVILAISSAFIILANKLHFSEIIGLIAAGLILSIPFFKNNVIAGHELILTNLSNLGLFTLMFVSGFEISGNMLSREKKDSLILTFLTITSSLFLGFIVLKSLNFTSETALIMGVCFGITAEATKARIFLELGKIKSRLGALLMGTGIINDVFGVLALVFITWLFTGNLSFKEIWILAGILLSFVLGIIIHIFFNRFSRKIKMLEKIFLYALVPFFFIEMGRQFDLSDLNLNFKIFLIVFTVSFCGQMTGSFLSKFFIKLNGRQTFLVGLSMNSKGAVELAIAFIALQLGILTVNLYSALIFTALISTVLFQISAFAIVKKNPGIMD